MGFNKTKHVTAAQKYLTQGKLPQAIAEYQNVLKYEPNDQITLMTVGDLFVRKGETFQAIEYFERLAQVFTRDGFLTKAIAIYKKIAKLAPEELKPLEKLAELYVQQGVLSEARPIFLQLAEGHLKAGRREMSAALLRKLLEAEPDNLRVQMRLADIQQAMGQVDDAAQTYLHCAERLLGSHEAAEAAKMAERALKLKPENLSAKTTLAKALSASGKRDASIALLEGMPDIETNDELATLLIEEHMEAGHPEKAGAFAKRIFEHDAKRYKLVMEVSSALLDKGEAQAALELIGPIRQAMIENGEQEKLAKTLKEISARAPGTLEPAEWLVALYEQVNDSFKMPEALAQLGQTAAAAGNMERAKQAYELLLARAPQDATVLENLNRVRAQLGLTASDVPTHSIKEEQTEADGQAPVFEEKPLDEETQKFVTTSLTDVDLFSSYGLTQKAIDLLEKVLIQAPRHTVSIEKLLDFYLGEGNHRRTAELAQLLAKIYTQRGDMAQAERFLELEKRFNRAATLDGDPPAESAPMASAPTAVASVATPAVNTMAPAEFQLPEMAADEGVIELVEPAETKKTPAKTEAAKAEKVQEIDLSEEWAELSNQTHSATPAPAEPRREQKIARPAHIESNTQPFAVEAAASDKAKAGGAAFDVSDEEDLTAALESFETAPAKPSKPAAGAKAKAPASPVIPMPTAKQPPAEELEYELELIEAAPRASSGAAATKRPSGPLGDLAAEFEESARSSAPAKSAKANGRHATENAELARAANAKQRGASDPGGPLSEIFQEFREQLDELQTDEDPETHYNLGVAYREMGLLEEAISEFQKVAKAHESGKDFRYAMQCCTLLGLAFLEKGQPEIAAFWYEKALQTSNLEAESVLALRYDLGVAQQLAGQSDAALKSFQQVYAMNIDYRDVSERITALRKA